jgi:hypothetical protein
MLRNDMLADPRFWATHYYLLVGNDEIAPAEIIESIFGVTNDAANEFYSKEFEKVPGVSGDWPRLRIAIGGDYCVDVEYAGEPDYETRFYINCERWPQAVCLGYQSGHFALPALRWHEVSQIACKASGIEGAQSLLLLFPSVYICGSDDRALVHATLREAWAQLALASKIQLDEMIDQTIDYQSIEVKWWTDATLGWINDGRYSFRNPKTRMCEFDVTRFSRVQELFAEIGSAH